MGWAKYHEDIVSRHNGTSLVQRQLRKQVADAPRAPEIRAQGTKRSTHVGEKKMSKLKEFTVSAARPLPVLVLADVSASMTVNGKIDALNEAIQSMVESFAAQDSGQAEIHVAVITFGKGGAKMHQPLMPATQVKWERLTAAGRTPMGAAFDLAAQLIEDQTQMPGRGYTPSVVLVSDGGANDEWREPLKRLLSLPRASKAARFALGIGDEADVGMLSEFLADPSARVYSAHEARQIKNFFRWVTMSVTQRTRSVDPDTRVVVDPTELDEYDF